MQGSRVLAVGVNTYRNDPNNTDSGFSIHAEIAAVSQHIDVPNTTLYVVRINRKGHPLNAQPCPQCTEYIVYQTKVREVIYT